MNKYLGTLILIFLSLLIYFGVVYDNKKNIEYDKKIQEVVDFEFVKTLKFQSYYQKHLEEICIYKDKNTGHLYMFYYGQKGISISRYYE
jgi:hypothetical protein